MTRKQPESPAAAPTRPMQPRPAHTGRTWGSEGMGLAMRLERSIDRDAADGHWLWTAGVNGSGYPIIGVEGRVRYVAHLMYEQVYGELPTRLWTFCGERRCVNPEHRRRTG